MFQKFEINSVHSETDPALRRYVSRKIGGLDKFLPRPIRQSAHAEVYLKENNGKSNNNCICEVTVYLPKQTVVISESAPNMYAAIDISEAKLKIQFNKYKDLHTSPKKRRHLTARFNRKET